MREAFEIFSIILLLFGGLAFWPLVRFGSGLSGGASDWLKWQFFAHIIVLAGSFVVVQYYYAIEHPDRLHSRILPYMIGALSWISALVILFGSGLWRRIGKGPGEPD
jgi:hypothetical protein